MSDELSLWTPMVHGARYDGGIEVVRRENYDALRAENEQLRRVASLADGLAGEFERAVASREKTGGMQVTPSGDFIACAQLPSAVSRMRWWAREIRAALAALDEKEKP